jgi:chitodextrinase
LSIATLPKKSPWTGVRANTVLAILAVASILALPAGASAEGVVIDNGTVQLGVNQTGELNVFGTPSAQGTNYVGLRLMSTNNDSTSPGCLCEGWGVADPATGTTGYADIAEGTANVNLDLFNATPQTAASTVTINDGSDQPALQVTHDFHPTGKTPYAYEVEVTVKNVGQTALDPVYRRVMDWDIEPTAFNEYVTITGNQSTGLISDSDNGFASADPLSPQGLIDQSGFFIDDGPTDHGAVFDFQLHHLNPGNATTFEFYYGAAPGQVTAQHAVSAVDGEVWSLAKPTTPDGLSLGEPNTFLWAFHGVGGDAATQHYASLGDSVAAGEGIGYGWQWDNAKHQWTGGVHDGTWEPAGSDGSPGTGCHRTVQAYGNVVALTLSARLFHFACTGWSGADVLEHLGSTKNSAGENAYAAANPQKVSVTVGADDVKFSDFVKSCYALNPFSSCVNSGNEAKADTLLATEKSNLEALLSHLSLGVGGNPAPLVAVTDYYSPFGIDRSCADYHVLGLGSASLSGGEQAWLGANLARLNANIRKVALRYRNVIYVPLDTVMQGHEWCSSDPWVYGVSIERHDHGSAAPFHPTPSGQIAIAQRMAHAFSTQRSVPAGSSSVAFSDGTRLSYSDVSDPGYAAVIGGSGGSIGAMSSAASEPRRASELSASTFDEDSAEQVFPPCTSFAPTRLFQIASSAQTSSPIQLQVPSADEETLYQVIGDEWQEVPGQSLGGGYVTANVDQLGQFALGEPAPVVTAVATAQVLQGDAPAQVAFSAAGSTVESGSLASYSWSFGDGTGGSGPNPTHLYERAGEYTAVVVVTSDTGARDRAQAVVRIGEEPPSASVRAPEGGEVGVPLTFTGSASSPRGAIVDSEWDFGDGSNAQGQLVPSHTYSSPGRYQVALTVADQDGTLAQASASVAIAPPGSAASPAAQGVSAGAGQPQHRRHHCKKKHVRKHGKCVKRKHRHHRHRR